MTQDRYCKIKKVRSFRDVAMHGIENVTLYDKSGSICKVIESQDYLDDVFRSVIDVTFQYAFINMKGGEFIIIDSENAVDGFIHRDVITK